MQNRSFPAPIADRGRVSTHRSGESHASLSDDWNDPQALLREYARTRDVRVRNRLVALHERIVHHLARHFRPSRCAAYEDLVQIGFLGLIGAIERYDPDRGIQFVTFAVPTIRGEIQHYLRDQNWGLKAPRRLRELGLSLRKLRDRLEHQLRRPPTTAELAEAAGVGEERLLEAMDLERLHPLTSLDSYLQMDADDSRTAFWETVGAPDPELGVVEEREAVQKAMERLSQRQRAIIYYRFFEDASQAQVARRLGISQMHVSRLERQALQFLRSLLS